MSTLLPMIVVGCIAVFVVTVGAWLFELRARRSCDRAMRRRRELARTVHALLVGALLVAGGCSSPRSTASVDSIRPAPVVVRRAPQPARSPEAASRPTLCRRAPERECREPGPCNALASLFCET